MRTGDAPAPVLFWGSYAFSIMNGGFLLMGLAAAAQNEPVAKASFLFATAAVFLAFASTWLSLTAPAAVIQGLGNKDPRKQGIKVAAFGVLFFVASVAMLL